MDLHIGCFDPAVNWLGGSGGRVLWVQADREQLQQLRGYQQSIGLGDDVASEIVKEAARARVEADLDAAVECIRRRTAERDYSEAVDAVRAAPCLGSYPICGDLHCSR